MNILFILLIVYLSLCLFIYFFQHLFFFRPEILPKHFTYKFPFPFEELQFNIDDGGLVNAIYFKVPKSLGIVYYLKGNSRSIKGWGKFAKDFLSNGYDFILIDYRGFGKSKGKRTQATLFNDAQTVYDWIKTQYDENKICLYGRSLGSGVAAYIASKNNPRLLILDSPYYSFYENIKRYIFFLPLKYLIRYDLLTNEYLKTVRAPIHIIHGEKDHLIPYKQSVQLKKLFPEKITLHPIKEGGHNDLPEFEEFYHILYAILYTQSNPEWQL